MINHITEDQNDFGAAGENGGQDSAINLFPDEENPFLTPERPRHEIEEVADRLLAEITAKAHYAPEILSQLRRLNAQQPEGAAYFRLLAQQVPQHLARDIAQERNWALVMQMAAYGSARGGSLGEVMYQAGYSESRFGRLISEKGSGLIDALHRAQRFANQKSLKIDPRSCLHLIFPELDTKEARRQANRDYFLASVGVR